MHAFISFFVSAWLAVSAIFSPTIPAHTPQQVATSSFPSSSDVTPTLPARIQKQTAKSNIPESNNATIDAKINPGRIIPTNGSSDNSGTAVALSITYEGGGLDDLTFSVRGGHSCADYSMWVMKDGVETEKKPLRITVSGASCAFVSSFRACSPNVWLTLREKGTAVGKVQLSSSCWSE